MDVWPRNACVIVNECEGILDSLDWLERNSVVCSWLRCKTKMCIELRYTRVCVYLRSERRLVRDSNLERRSPPCCSPWKTYVSVRTIGHYMNYYLRSNQRHDSFSHSHSCQIRKH